MDHDDGSFLCLSVPSWMSSINRVELNNSIKFVMALIGACAIEKKTQPHHETYYYSLSVSFVSHFRFEWHDDRRDAPSRFHDNDISHVPSPVLVRRRSFRREHIRNRIPKTTSMMSYSQSGNLMMLRLFGASCILLSLLTSSQSEAFPVVYNPADDGDQGKRLFYIFTTYIPTGEKYQRNLHLCCSFTHGAV